MATSSVTRLIESAGAEVDKFRQKLIEARELMDAAEDTLKQANTEKYSAGQECARFEVVADNLDNAFLNASGTRHQAVDNHQQFAKTALVAIAVPDVDIPDLQIPWTIEPALTLARRVEQALVAVNDDDPSWQRITKTDFPGSH